MIKISFLNFVLKELTRFFNAPMHLELPFTDELSTAHHASNRADQMPHYMPLIMHKVVEQYPTLIAQVKPFPIMHF